MIGFLMGNWQRFVAYGVVAFALAGAVWAHGYSRGQLQLFEYRADEAVRAVKIAKAREIVTEKVVNNYIKVAGETRVVERTVEKEVVRYVAHNSGYCLDARWGELHDAAAENRLPAPAIGPDVARGAPTAATAIETTAENYAGCHRTADRLDALQAWVDGQMGVEE